MHKVIFIISCNRGGSKIQSSLVTERKEFVKFSTIFERITGEFPIKFMKITKILIWIERFGKL